VSLGVKIDIDDKGLRDLRDLLNLPNGRLLAASVWTGIGEEVLDDQRRQFVKRSKTLQDDWGNTWAPLGWFTKLFRHEMRVKTLPDLDSRRGEVLADTGRLLNSLNRESPDVRFETGVFHVTVGTNVPYAAQHEQGGTFTPTYRREGLDLIRSIPGKKATNADSLSKHVLPGGKGRWHPEFFRIRGALEKRSGKAVQFPARAIVVEPPQGRVEKYARRMSTAIQAALRRAGR